jgi:hypothetical protein
MKMLLSGAVGFFVSLACSTAFAQPTAYTFATVDVSVPERPGSIAIPEDINDAGVIVTNIYSLSYGAEAVIADPARRGTPQFTTTLFQCADSAFADAQAVAISRNGDLVGSCLTAPNGSKVHGFIRDRSGQHLLLDFPNADHTLPRGISSHGDVVGYYYNPFESNRSGLFRIHGFRWSDGDFQTIDFPLADAYTVLKSINRRGQVLGEYYRFNAATNETLEHNWFVYDDGHFRLDFPPSLEWSGGPALFLADINDAGQIIAMRYNGGPEWNGLFVVEDGVFDEIPVPPDFVYVDVRGMNNKGQFVGMYMTQVGVDPFSGWPLYETHGYIATPASTTGPTSFRRGRLED